MHVALIKRIPQEMLILQPAAAGWEELPGHSDNDTDA